MVLPVLIRLGHPVLLPHTRLDGIAVVGASTIAAIAKNVPLPCQRESIWVWSSMNGSQRGRPSFCVLDFVKAEMAENKWKKTLFRNHDAISSFNVRLRKIITSSVPPFIIHSSIALSTHPIFPSWDFSHWTDVDDRVRGGSSTSHLDPFDDSSALSGSEKGKTAARFWGHLGEKLLVN